MSIIHDALKKVQEEQKKEAQQQEGAITSHPNSPYNDQHQTPTSHSESIQEPTAIESTPQTRSQFQSKPDDITEKKAPQTPLIKNVLITFAAIIVIALVSLKIFSQKKHENMPLKPKPVETPVIQSVPAQAEKSTASTHNYISVQGIMNDAPGKSIALINNEIYKEGDLLDGKKILQITIKNITVLNGDQKEVLIIK